VVVYLSMVRFAGDFFNFVYKCMFSAVDVVRSVAHYAVTYGLNHSPLGRNLLFCMIRHKCSLYDIYRSNISRIYGFIVKRVLIIVQLVVCSRLIS